MVMREAGEVRSAAIRQTQRATVKNAMPLRRPMRTRIMLFSKILTIAQRGDYAVLRSADPDPRRIKINTTTHSTPARRQAVSKTPCAGALNYEREVTRTPNLL